MCRSNGHLEIFSHHLSALGDRLEDFSELLTLQQGVLQQDFFLKHILQPFNL